MNIVVNYFKDVSFNYVTQLKFWIV